MKFSDFKDIHKGETIIVCGLGESMKEFHNPEDWITIGVNDIGRLFAPTYLLNVNNKTQYKGDRFSYIENTKAKYIFTHTPKEQGCTDATIVKFTIDRHSGGVEIVGDRLPHARNSPYMAIALAAHMGARRIGLLGVDFTPNHFFAKDGEHRLLGELKQINERYGKLAVYLNANGCGVWNLSPSSKITSIPKASLEAWNREKQNVRDTFTFTQIAQTM